MSAQLNIRGNIIELEEQITYNFQAGDIADFSAIKSNYTSSFKIPKTQDVVRLFEGLGIPSDMSRLPYTITDVQCLDDYTIVYEGSLIILRTDSLYYHSTVISGAKVFSDAIAGLTLYDVVGSEITNKTPENVLDKLRDNSSSPTKYMFANYGGEREISGRNGAIDIDLFAESVSVSFLLDSIFALSGFTYSIPDTIDLSDEYLAMPIPPLINYAQVSQRVVSAQKTTPHSGFISSGGEITGYESWDSVAVENIYFNQSGSWNFVCSFPDDYVIIFHNIIARASGSAGQNWYPLTVEVKVNGQMVGRFSASTQSTEKNELYRTVIGLDVGDIVEIDLIRPPETPGSIFEIYRVDSIDYGIYNISSDSDKLRDAIDLSLADFIKEFCYRYALIPIHDGNSINFIGFHDIIDNWNVLDWTDRYIYRNEETYTLDYGNNNWLKHSYVDESDTQYNLSIPSFNDNAEVNHDIVVSKIFAPNRNGVFGIYDSNLQGDGTFTTKTNKRFYWIKRVRRFSTEEIRVASRTVPGYIVSVGGVLNFAEYTAAFSDSDRWRTLERVIQNLRVHNIDLHLTSVDVSQLLLDKIYFFEQEMSYYMLNRLRYTKGTISGGEFVKINCAWGWEAYSQHCEQSGGQNTGRVVVDDIINLATGDILPNHPGQDGYIAPYEDLCECPSNDLFFLFRLSTAYPSNLPFILDEGTNVNRVELREGLTGTGTLISFQETSDHSKLLSAPSISGDKAVVYQGNACEVTRIEVTSDSFITVIDFTVFTNIERIRVTGQLGLSSTGSFSIANNEHLTYIDIRGNGFTTGSSFSILDSVINNLDIFGKAGGTLIYADNNVSGAQPSSASRQAYDNLIAKGWSITGRPPLT